MNVIKLILLLFLLPLSSLSQEKKDAYFVIDISHEKYLIKTRGGNLNKAKYHKINQFIIYDRSEYEKDVKERKKSEYTGFRSKGIPKTLYFNVKKEEKQLLKYCEIHELKIVNYDWLIKNSWKENNPNVLFENLYFLFKLNKDLFIKYKVGRTIVAY